eukprot:GHUV01033918.1.p1 GENE.GHUV01033918.1~~GHUV01033918.1.p1  ORF type:complete len:161 (+),score=13.67 GHUV01033918.1:898-1380(+)
MHCTVWYALSIQLHCRALTERCCFGKLARSCLTTPRSSASINTVTPLMLDSQPIFPLWRVWHKRVPKQPKYSTTAKHTSQNAALQHYYGCWPLGHRHLACILHNVRVLTHCTMLDSGHSRWLVPVVHVHGKLAAMVVWTHRHQSVDPNDPLYGLPTHGTS